MAGKRIFGESEPAFMTAGEAAQRRGFAAASELALRQQVEALCRARWPQARVVHELVIGEGQVRADVVAIDETHLAAFEIKGAYDETTRLLHQVGMYQLAVPEVWIVVTAERGHADDARLIRHLLPSVGLAVAAAAPGRNFGGIYGGDPGEVTLTIEAEPRPLTPVPECLLRVLWRDELAQACSRLGVAHGKRSTRDHMVRELLRLATPDELLRQVCAGLRAREARWRADPPLAVDTARGAVA